MWLRRRSFRALAACLQRRCGDEAAISKDGASGMRIYLMKALV